jgi:hypothetical protein
MSGPWGDAAAGKRPAGTVSGLRKRRRLQDHGLLPGQKKPVPGRPKKNARKYGVKGQDAPRQPLSGPKRKVRDPDSEDDADSGTRRRAARCTEGTAASVYPP